MEVHAAVLMSTHEHLVVTDPAGKLPLFLRSLHRQVALGTKVLRKWEGAVWDHEKMSVVRLLTDQAIFEKLAYVMANPVQAGLVRRAQDWPGVTVCPQDLGQRVLTANRPDAYFDAANAQWPQTAQLQLSLPRSLIDRYARQDIADTVSDELRLQEQVARRTVQAKGWTVMGAQRIQRCSPYLRAKSFEPLVGRNPTFAVGRRQKRAFFKAVEALRAFRVAYRDALEQWRSGVRDALFPAGTWWMWWTHGASVVDDT